MRESWRKPQWNGKRRIDHPVNWTHLPEYDFGIAWTQVKEDWGHSNTWFIYNRDRTTNKIVAAPVFAQDVITATGTGTYTSKVSWNNSNNKVEVVAGGGCGAIGASTTTGGGGGAGGGYNSISNFSFATPGTTTALYGVGVGGHWTSSSVTNGGDTWFNSAAFPASGTAVGAKGGPSPATFNTATGGTAALTSTFFPTTSPPARVGGNGASGTSASVGGGGGGGGGPNGVGGNASSNTGGTGDGGTVTAGAAGNPGTAFAGKQFGTSLLAVGIGGGGGGSNASAGKGATAIGYGGAGGGGSRSNSTLAGDGFQGVVVLSWNIADRPDGIDFPNPTSKKIPTDQLTIAEAGNALTAPAVTTTTLLGAVEDWLDLGRRTRVDLLTWLNTGTALLNALAPFSQDDWPNPKGPAPQELTHIDQGILTLPTVTVAPNFLTDWPNPKGAKSNQPLSWSSRAQITAPVVTAPFGQANWPLPNRGLPLDYGSIDQGFLPPTQAPGPPLPPINYDWPNPRGYLYPTDLRTFINQGLPYPVTFARAPAFQALYRSQANVRWDQPPNIVIKTTVAAPFNQDDWPLPTKAKANQSLGIERGPQITPNPFNQDDWPLPTGAKSNQPFSISLRPQITPNPFKQTEWVNPSGAKANQPLGLTTWPQLTSANNPFNQFDWALPKGAKSTQPLSAWGIPQITPNPFNQDDWPNPTGAKANQPFSVVRTPQITPNPFSQTDWPLAVTLRRAIDTWIPTNVALASAIAQVVPFNQDDWQNPRGATPNQSLGLSGHAQITPNPFSQSDWQNPRGSRPNQALGINAAPQIQTTASPFVQSDWPNPLGKKSNQVLGISRSPQIKINPQAFVQTDWPVPKGPQRAIDLLTLTNANAIHYPEPVPNIGPFDYPNPKIPPPLNWSFRASPYIPAPIPPPPAAPGDYFFKFNDQTDAFLDPIVGPRLALPGKLIPIWIYDTSKQSAEVVDGWWCLLVVDAPVPSSISQHPNLQFALDRQAAFTPGYAHGQGTIIIINNLIPPIELSYFQIVSPMAPVAYANAGIH
jgi:hypothetical protein